MLHRIFLLVLVATFAACGSAPKPSLAKRFPYTVGVKPVSVKSDPRKSIAQEDVTSLKVKFEPQKLTGQVKESLEGIFEQVVVLDDLASQAPIDLIIAPNLSYDERVTTSGDGWLLSGLCFALGTPLGWFIDDRKYEAASDITCPVSLPGKGVGAANASMSGFVQLKPRSQPTPMTFWDRADNVGHYLGGLVLPAVLLASESDSVGKNLTEAMGKKLADGLAREFLDKGDKLKEGDRRADFTLTDHGLRDKSLFCTWSYKSSGSQGFDVFYVINGQEEKRGKLQEGALDATTKAVEWTLVIEDAVSPGSLVYVRAKQLGGSGAERTYTLRMPSAGS